VEDVEKAFRDAQDAVAEAGGRVTRSDLSSRHSFSSSCARSKSKTYLPSK